MHLDFITQGINQQVEIFKIFMQAQMFNWKRTNKETGEESISGVQGRLTPVQLWSYVFPEECLDEVLAMLELDPNAKDYVISDSKMAILRKMLGCKKIPSIPKIPRTKYVEKRGVSIHLIGIRYDARGEMKDWDAEKKQEMTWLQELL